MQTTQNEQGGFDSTLNRHSIFDSSSAICTIAQASHQNLEAAGMGQECLNLKATCEEQAGVTLAFHPV